MDFTRLTVIGSQEAITPTIINGIQEEVGETLSKEKLETFDKTPFDVFNDIEISQIDKYSKDISSYSKKELIEYININLSRLSTAMSTSGKFNNFSLNKKIIETLRLQNINYVFANLEKEKFNQLAKTFKKNYKNEAYLSKVTIDFNNSTINILCSQEGLYKNENNELFNKKIDYQVNKKAEILNNRFSIHNKDFNKINYTMKNNLQDFINISNDLKLGLAFEIRTQAGGKEFYAQDIIRDYIIQDEEKALIEDINARRDKEQEIKKQNMLDKKGSPPPNSINKEIPTYENQNQTKTDKIPTNNIPLGNKNEIDESFKDIRLELEAKQKIELEALEKSFKLKEEMRNSFNEYIINQNKTFEEAVNILKQGYRDITPQIDIIINIIATQEYKRNEINKVKLKQAQVNNDELTKKNKSLSSNLELTKKAFQDEKINLIQEVDIKKEVISKLEEQAIKTKKENLEILENLKEQSITSINKLKDLVDEKDKEIQELKNKLENKETSQKENIEDIVKQVINNQNNKPNNQRRQ